MLNTVTALECKLSRTAVDILVLICLQQAGRLLRAVEFVPGNYACVDRDKA